MMNPMRLVILFFLASCVYSQELPNTPTPKPAPCSTHTRGFFSGHWFSSNMCQDDYDKWLTANPPKEIHKDPWFWGGEAVIAGCMAADAYSTTEGQARGLIESNPILGPHPSSAAVAGWSLVGLAGWTTLNYLSHHFGRKDPSAFWRYGSKVDIALMAGIIHCKNAVENFDHPSVPREVKP